MTDQLRLDIFDGMPGAFEDDEDTRLSAAVNVLQLQPGGTTGYRLRRIILCNYWLYGLQEFEVAQGRLFLAGENASGKSSVLAAALPLSLDGDYRPNRLDTFGGRERKMEYYVLGGESSTAYSFERRTTYIALEFEWCNPEKPPYAPDLRQLWLEGNEEEREQSRWLTLGISLAGNKNVSPPLRALRFVVTDGARFGHALHLVDSKAVALDHPGFKRMLGEHGVVCDTVAEYQERVSRYLFGIEDPREFQNIMNMLLVLRRPNLGSELNITNVHNYLKQSLRKIPEDITRQVTGTIERIDNIQSQLERLQDAHESATRLDAASQRLAVAHARRAALDFWRTRQAEISALGRVTMLKKELASGEAEFAAASARFAELTTEEQQLEGQISALESSEGLQVAERLSKVRESAEQAASQLARQKGQLERAKATLQEMRARRERLVSAWDKQKGEIRERLNNLQKQGTSEAGWSLAGAQLEEVRRQLEAFSLESAAVPPVPPGLTGLAGSFSEERLERLKRLEELHHERDNAAINERIVREREAEKLSEYDDARQARDDAQEVVNSAREALATRLRQLYRESSWVSELPDYHLAEVNRAILHEALPDYSEVAQRFGNELERSAARLQEEHSRLLQAKGAQQRKVEELDELYRRKLAETDLTPARSPRRQQARDNLNKAGIESYPLYALVDFSSNLDPEKAGGVERMLEDAGLLDALIILPGQQREAVQLLREKGLDEAWIQPSLTQPQAGSALSEWLVFDAEAIENGRSGEWQVQVEAFLKSIVLQKNTEAKTGAVIGESGEWRHGLLSGQSGRGPATGFIGTANRRRLRRQELDALQVRLEEARRELRLIEGQLEQKQVQQRELSVEKAALDEIIRAEQVARAEEDRNRAEAEKGRAEKAMQEAQALAREARQKLTGLAARILQESQDIPGGDTDLRRLRVLIDATVRLKAECGMLLQSSGTLEERWQQHRDIRNDLEIARQNEEATYQLFNEIQARYTQVEAERQELEQLMANTGFQDLIERLAQLRVRRQELPKALTDAYGEQVRAEERVRNTTASLEQAEEILGQAQQQRSANQNIFSLRLAAYPVPRLTEVRIMTERDDFAKAAQRLLGSGSNQPLPDQEQLENDYNRAFNELNIKFHEERSVLAEYGPEMEAEGRISFVLEERVEPPALLELLSRQIEVQKTLLGNEERALFEDFLLQEMAEAIRSHINGTEEWVRKINRLLDNLPMVGEHYALEWKPADDTAFVDGLGSYIARQHRLLRKQSRNLTEDEKHLLMDAFRREIDNLRLRQKEEPGLNFIEALIQIFDYREWFHFSVFVTPHGGQRLRLTDRTLSSRSGAEQLFALYVPLFAALAALYDSSAASGCPRLLALDEAFDKASAANTQKIMEFLVSQGFQWIMTGPQVSGMGSGVPVSTEYQMMHEKGSLVATAVPFFWVAGQELPGK